MKILILSPEHPIPLHEGAHHVVYNQKMALVELGHDVTLYSWKRLPDSFLQKEALGSSFLFQKTPENFSTSRPSRLKNLFLCETAFGESYYYGGLNKAEILPSLEACDLAIFHYSFAHHTIKSLPERLQKKCIVYFHNLESTLYDLRAKQSRWPLSRIYSLNTKILLKPEKELQTLAKSCWYLSHFDFINSSSIQSSSGGVFVPPVYFPTKRLPKMASSPTLGFIGGMNFIPNHESVNWILKSVCPSLLKLGFQGTLQIAGKSPSEDLLNFAKHLSFVKFLGFLENTEDFWNSIDIFLIPHIIGSGVRTKALESLSRGIPTFINQNLMEQIDPKLQKHPLLFVSDDGEAWSKKIMSFSSWANQLDDFEISKANAILGAKSVYSFLK